MNEQKTKRIALNKDAANAIHLDNEELGQTEDYKYLDAWIMSSANDIEIRKALAFQAITRLNRVWKANLTRKTKIRLFQATVIPILLMYGSETWALTKEQTRRLEGACTYSEAQLIHTLSKFHRLIHELCPTNHHSSQEHATYGTSCLLLAFLNLTTCHLSNPRSINLI